MSKTNFLVAKKYNHVNKAESLTLVDMCMPSGQSLFETFTCTVKNL